MREFYFQLNLNYRECENLYLPGINTVMMTSEKGERVQLPTKNLRPFLTKTGIQGRFRLRINKNNKVVDFEKVR